MSDSYRPQGADYARPSYRRDKSTPPNIIVQIGYALVAVWRLIFRPKRPALDSAKLRAQMNAIESAITGDGAPAAQAILQADSVLDSVMRSVNGRGEVFADRLRSLENHFEPPLYQEVWAAHKLRNTIAHEHPFVGMAQARQAVSVFRRAASRLGAF